MKAFIVAILIIAAIISVECNCRTQLVSTNDIDRSTFILRCDYDVEKVIISTAPETGKILDARTFSILKKDSKIVSGEKYYFVASEEHRRDTPGMEVAIDLKITVKGETVEKTVVVMPQKK